MAKLPSVFKKGGVVSAGNASGICDGAAANVIASEEAVKRFNLTPLAKILAYHVVGEFCRSILSCHDNIEALQNSRGADTDGHWSCKCMFCVLFDRV